MINDKPPPSSRGTCEVKDLVYVEWLKDDHVRDNRSPHFEISRSRLSPSCPSQFPRYPKKPKPITRRKKHHIMHLLAVKQGGALSHSSPGVIRYVWTHIQTFHASHSSMLLGMTAAYKVKP
ncbi:uncharacterized protein FSUBG_14027 [Fusarium subglutinans]|uniref:Uncharacterized protein n=1 Tax=Gibberella subglutinans TaxID=42677 RepID=A0A8H5KKY0_GIBSU|nr:uncharacterized protein FSUBG_14027 [Fusarium subglutinans]KAF5574638.1 hypothetical protein FSUBG_14027 [Fusarium subglutinans]